MAGYTRQSTFADGDIIQAADFNDEYNQLVNSFDNTTGHAHDGTSGEGPVIGLIGDPGVAAPINKVVVDDTNNRVGVFIDAGGLGSSVEQVRIQDGVIVPVITNDVDLGTSSLQFKDGYFAGSLEVGGVSVGGGASIGTILDEDDMVSDDDTALATQQSIKAYVDAQVTAQDLDVAADTGTAAVDLDSQSFTVAGTTNEIETSATGQTVTIGLPNDVTIGNDLTVTNDATISNDLTVTNDATITNDLTVNGNTTLGDAATDTVTVTADIASNLIPSADDTYDLGATGSEWKDIYINGVAYVDSVAMPTTTVTDILDEDTMTSDSDTALATQQSIKAYVDAQITANNELDEVTDVTITAVADNEVLAYDSTSSEWINQTPAEAGLVSLTGTETLTNKTLTSPVLDGTISGTSIKDEDTMVSDSDTHLATQQSIKAYVDSQVGGVSAEVVNDTTPQLGGDLDVNGQSIVSVSNGNIAITPDGTGSVILDGLSYPQADGTVGQVIKTDGAGNLTFASPATGLADVVDDTTPQLGGTLDVNGQLIQFNDSTTATDDRLQFGSGQELEIYQDPNNNHSTIVSSAIGGLYMKSDYSGLMSEDGSKTFVYATGGGVSINDGLGSTRLKTTNIGGVEVTGFMQYNDTSSGSFNYIRFQAPSTLTTNTTFTFPDGDGTNGQALVTNGSGTLSWDTPTITETDPSALAFAIALG
jgi:hypothetical protein